MAGELLMSISKDEKERAIFRSRRKYQTDLASDLATAEDIGVAKGIILGRAEGVLSVAINLKRAGILPFDEIAQLTGLSLAEIEKL